MKKINLKNNYTISDLKEVLCQNSLGYDIKLNYYFKRDCGMFVVSDKKIREDGLVLLLSSDKLKGSRNFNKVLNYHTKKWYKDNGYKEVDKVFAFAKENNITFSVANPYYKCAEPMQLISELSFEAIKTNSGFKSFKKAKATDRKTTKKTAVNVNIQFVVDFLNYFLTKDEDLQYLLRLIQDYNDGEGVTARLLVFLLDKVKEDYQRYVEVATYSNQQLKSLGINKDLYDEEMPHIVSLVTEYLQR